MADALADARQALAEARMRFETALLNATAIDGRLKAYVRRRPFFDLNPATLAQHDALIAELRDEELPAAQAAAQTAFDAADEAQTAYDDAAATMPPVWADETLEPVLLLPLRLETTYRTTDAGGVELWIRAYPDDVHVDSHEEGLTQHERAAADSFTVGGDGAWRELVAALGLNRAAWVTEVLRREAAGEPQAPERAAPWTRAAKARLLPERLVFSGYRRGRLLWRREGAVIPADIDVGLKPPEPDDGDRDGPFHEEAAWLVDFDKAVDRGLGLRVPMTEPDLAFDRVTVLGVSADDGTQAFADLLDAHTYTDGLGVLPVGTPTNNTPETRAGWRSRPVPRTPDEVEQQRESYDPESLQPIARLAAVLGIDGARSLALAPDAIDDDGDDGQAAEKLTMLANQAIGRLFSVSRDWIPFGSTTRPDLGRLLEHMSLYVRNRGPLPMLRIGRQPYGVLPVTPLGLWRGGGTEDNIAIAARSVRAAFAERGDRAPKVGTGPDQIATILDVLSRRPASRRIVVDRRDPPAEDTIPPPPTVGIIDHSTRFGLRWPSTSGVELAVADPPHPTLQELVRQRPLSALLALIDEAADLVRATPVEQEIDFSAIEPRLETLKAALEPVIELPTSGLLLSIYAPVLHASLIFIPLAVRAQMAVEQGQPPDTPGILLGLGIAEPLEAMRKDVKAIEDAAVADLGAVERALAEAFDLTAHRLDAWVTSLAFSRLDTVRSDHAPTGLRTGAYGWLHDVRPAEPSLRAASDGYIVAPSIHHAATAAVLRSGWLETSEQTTLDVDLRSSRVRRALALLDGARSGQPLAALLGYRFERELHERGLDRLIDDFRGVFPLAPQVEPEVDDGRIDDARAAAAARDVVDGQALRKAFAAGATGFALGGDEDQVREAVAELDDAVDALGDLLLAESVHHLVGGTPLRAGLSADTIGRGEGLPQELDVLTTPRSGRLVSYAAGALVAGGGATGWTDTALAQLEPGLERWCAARLGPAAGWGLDTLGMSALETVLGAAPDGPVVRRLAREGVAVPDDRLGELLMLCERLRGVLSTAVPLDGSHLDPLDGAGLTTADLDELAARVNAWLTVVGAATRALRDADDDAARATALGTLSAAGLGAAMPGGPGDDLAVRTADVLARLTTAAPPAALPAPPSAHARTAPAALAWIAAATAAVRALTGDGVALLPVLRLDGTDAGRSLSRDHRPAGADEDAVADTVRELGRVRPAVRTLDDALLGAEVLAGTGSPAWTVAQTPTAQDAPWVAVTASPARSCALLAADGAVDPRAVRGFVCDQWTEVLPDGGPDEVAAIAIHHDRPDARAPHALLVAVPPDTGRGWRMEDLHAVVDDTFELARLRPLDLADLPDLGGIFPPDAFLAGLDI